MMIYQNLQFEDALQRLEAVVKRLEAGNVPLDEALSFYEEGVGLVRFCNEKLDAAQLRVDMVKSTAQGFVTEPFDREKA
jgi:exodeoxyribonuclease VII small subunit